MGGNDGVKVREFVLLKGKQGLQEQKSDGRKLFVNMCSYSTLSPPKDDFGHEFKDVNSLHTNGVEIPMVIGSIIYL